MARILVTLFTLLCFTGCTTLQAVDATPSSIGQPSQPAEAVQLDQSDAPPAADNSTATWVTLGVLAVIVGVLIVTADSGSGGGY